ARRPLWAVFPTERLAKVVLGLGVLWLIPGAVGRTVAIGASIVLVGAVAFDYLRLPSSRRLSVERSVPNTIGLGDTTDFTYTLHSDWPWPSRVQLFDTLPSGLSAGATLEIVELKGREERTL